MSDLRLYCNWILSDFTLLAVFIWFFYLLYPPGPALLYDSLCDSLYDSLVTAYLLYPPGPALLYEGAHAVLELRRAGDQP